MNAYQATKAQAEHVIERAAAERGLSVVIARLTPLYGPGDRRMLRLFRDIARGRPLMIGAGTQRCHLTHIDDAIEGLRLCGARVQARGERFILAGDQPTTVQKLFEVVAAALGVNPRIVHLPAAPFLAARALYRVLTSRFAPVPGIIDRLDFFLSDHVYDASKARRELGFETNIALSDGIAATAAYYRETNLI
jgi:nucleoside-diphosphate-sugar epimerase